MAEMTASSGRRFGLALANGLGWGVLVTSVGGGLTMALASLITGATIAKTAHQAFETTIWFAFGATLFAVLLIGPIAGVTGWLIYRSGVRSPVVYAAVGSLSALVAPLLVVVVGVGTMRYQSDANAAVVSDPGILLFFASFAVVGAFAGYMAGRRLRD